VGEGINATFHKTNIKGLQDIEKDSDIKNKLYFVIDNIIQKPGGALRGFCYFIDA
jgi:hypothetical protein